MKLFNILVFIFISINLNQANADEPSSWLKKEIDKILVSYQNSNLPKENRFLMIEQTINNNFAGAGIAKFVAGEAWKGASKDAKKQYIKYFKTDVNRLNLNLK